MNGENLVNDRTSSPKRPMNCFILFCTNEREKLKKENSDLLKDPNLMYILSKRWKEAPYEEKEKYKTMAMESYQKFKQENPEFKYKKAKKPKNQKKKSIQVPNFEQDSLQLLNHLFQNNPFLLQQFVENKDKSGRPNIQKCIFPN